MLTPPDFVAKVEANIAEYGVHVTWVADEAPFAYTVGLARRGHEELLISGLGPSYAVGILQDIAHMVLEAGAVLKPGDRFAIQPGKAEVLVLAVDDEVARDVALWAWSYNPKDIPVHVLQVLLPDSGGHFPWEEACDPQWAEVQYVYGRRLDV